ncbi:DUF51 family protein [Cunninghamella echinulata]|nr:DUF51 family protein [Cunninghamella echinulata]
MSKVINQEHCYYCFEVLIAYLEDKPLPEATFENKEYPLFVTWHINNRGHQRLRGCIGNFNEMPIRKGLKQYSLTSALHDRRFSPITLEEIPKLSCAVSFLTDFELGKDYLDWEIGKHGIWIEFSLDDKETASHHGSKRAKTTATYLPEVMVDQGWTQKEAIDSLLRKGGYIGKITEEKRKSIQLTRYQSQKLELSYTDYENANFSTS